MWRSAKTRNDNATIPFADATQRAPWKRLRHLQEVGPRQLSGKSTRKTFVNNVRIADVFGTSQIQQFCNVLLERQYWKENKLQMRFGRLMKTSKRVGIFFILF